MSAADKAAAELLARRTTDRIASRTSMICCPRDAATRDASLQQHQRQPQQADCLDRGARLRSYQGSVAAFKMARGHEDQTGRQDAELE